MAAMYKADGPLHMNPDLYRKWIANKQEKIKKKYKAFFCFDDTLYTSQSKGRTLSHYHALRVHDCGC